MRLSHPMFSVPIVWKEGRIPVLVLEHPQTFRSMVFSLGRQARGEDGDFVLSLDFEPMNCAEHLHVIFDYTSLALDDRKLQNRFQAFLQSLVHEELAEETDCLQQTIVQYLRDLCTYLDYPVSFCEGEYVLPLLKALKCQPTLNAEHPLERLMQYIELYHGFMKEQCFVLVHAHCYFSEQELSELYRMAAYQKWKILLVEQHFSSPLPQEDVFLIDESFCELHLDS